MNGKKWQFIPFSFYDVTGMEQHLETMARRGWMLERIGNFGWYYRRCTPETVHFAVTYYPRASAFEPEPSEGQQTLQDFCDHAGWQLLAANAQLLVFANRQEDPVPIHTDPLPKLETLEKLSRRTLVCWFLLLAVLLFGGWLFVGRLLRDPVGLLASPSELVNGGLTCLLLLYILTDLFTWFRWRKRARAAAEQGEFLPTHGHTAITGCSWASWDWGFSACSIC